MKDLIAVFTYCPDDERKIILTELLKELQTVKNNFDIIVVSHSELPNNITSLIDFSYIENDNKLLFDFDITNKFWFNTEIFFAHSSLIYPFSTHLSIYSLLHYVINFAKFKKYKKVHCIEYDINLDNTLIINETNNDLDTFENVIFKSDDGWNHGVYFAFKVDNLPEKYYEYDENFIKNEIKNVENRMTENYTPKFLGINNRKTFFNHVNNINKLGLLQKKDSHGNEDLNWCVPIVDKGDDTVHFLTFNEKGGEYKMDLLVDGNHTYIDIDVEKNWKLIPIGHLNTISDFKLLINGKLRHHIKFDNENRQKFKDNNFFIRK